MASQLWDVETRHLQPCSGINLISSSANQFSVGAMHFAHSVRMKVYMVSYWCPAAPGRRRFHSLRSITGLKPNGRRSPISNRFTCNKLYITTVRRRAISNGCWPSLKPDTHHGVMPNTLSCHGPKVIYTIADSRYQIFMQYLSFSKAEPSLNPNSPWGRVTVRLGIHHDVICQLRDQLGH